VTESLLSPRRCDDSSIAGDEIHAVRVLHIVTSSALAGIERHVLRTVIELRKLGCLAEIACPRSAIDLRAQAAAAGVPVYPPIRLRRTARPAIIHVHDGRAAVIGSALVALRGARLVRTQHFVVPAAVTRAGWRRDISMALHRRINRRVEAYVAVSRAALEASLSRREIDADKAVVIAPGVGLPPVESVNRAKLLREAATCPLVASVGRLEPERRFDVFVDAMPLVRRRVGDCRFLIVGAGSQELGLKRRAHDLGVDDALTWSGWLADPAPSYMGGHAYINTAPMEGFGMALAEAMSFALPVVTTKSGASSELVDDGASGYLIPPGDPAALAEAICSLVTSPARAATMGERGREISARYSYERTARQTLELYRSIL